MISSHFFKVFEYCLLPSIKSLPLCPSQFGYRSGSSTVLANAILKETIERYFCAGSPVYSCFLDLSKAFERVNHEFFLQKLERKGCPSHTVNILRTIYRHTRVRVHVGGTFSDEWSTGRGVRQGGVTSAYLFNVYIDDILSNISSMNVGCRLGIKRVNVQC